MILALACAACARGVVEEARPLSDSGVDSRRDAGGEVDAGAGSDAGPVLDAGSDGGASTDAGTGADSGTSNDAGTSTDAGASADPCLRPLFPASAPWNQRVDSAPADGQSDAVIAALQTLGWGLGRMQVDTSFHVMCDRTGAAPKRSFTPTGDFYDPDCDPAPVPVPVGGHLEGETGYACLGDGDCHLIVVAPTEHRLYEQWRVDIVGSTFNGGCLAIWDTSVTPPLTLRGDQCTSADAGGFPIAALLFDADEVASGHIDHAIRFILPNDIIRTRTYVRPATHATNSTGGATSVPYGARLRLRGDHLTAVLAALPNEYARTVARALHDYGMILSDGGNVALTAEDDERTTAKWDNTTSNRALATGLGARDLQSISPSDFEMVEGGARIAFTGDCTRTPIQQ